MVSRILYAAVLILLLIPLHVNSATNVAYLDLHVTGELPAGLTRNTFFATSDARFAVKRDGDYILVGVSPEDRTRSAWQLSFLLPNANQVGATILSSVDNAFDTTQDRMRCNSLAFFDRTSDQAATVPSTGPDVGWSFLTELVETANEVQSVAFSFEVACGPTAGAAATIIRGNLAYEMSPPELTLRLPSAGFTPAAAMPTERVREQQILATVPKQSALNAVDQVWVSTGQLVELRFGHPSQAGQERVGTIKVVALSKLPSEATILGNLGGGQSMFWVPSGEDIGTHNFEFQTFDTTNEKYLGNANVVVEVLPGDVSDLSLNALPDIQFDRALVKEGMARVAVGETMEMRVYAKDRNGNTPLLNLKNVPDGATTLQVTEGEGRITWTPTANDRGYNNITVIAVDADDKQRFTEKTMNVEVLASGYRSAPRINPFKVVPPPPAEIYSSAPIDDENLASAEE